MRNGKITSIHSKTIVIAMAGLLSATALVPAHAAEVAGGDLSANLALVSEYSFRGVSQSDQHPALQGGVDYSHGVLSDSTAAYVGAWASNVDFNDGNEATVELDVYAGLTHDIGKASFDVGAIYYAYPGADSSLDYDYAEFKAKAGYDLGFTEVYGAYYYSPEFFAKSGDAHYFEAGFKSPLPHDFYVSGVAGYQKIEDNATYGVPDYGNWGLSLGYVYNGFDFSANYVDSNLSDGVCATGCEAKLLFKIAKTF